MVKGIGEKEILIISSVIVGGIVIYKSGFLSKAGEGVGVGAANFGTGIGNIGTGIGNIGTGLGGGLYNIGSGVEYLGAGLGGGLYNIGSGVGSIGLGIGNTFSGLGNFESMLGQGISNFLTGWGTFGGSMDTQWGKFTFGAGANNPSGYSNNQFPFQNTNSTTKSEFIQPEPSNSTHKEPTRTTSSSKVSKSSYPITQTQKAELSKAQSQTPYAKAMAITPTAKATLPTQAISKVQNFKII